MKYYFLDKPVANLTNIVTPKKMEVIVQRPIAEVPISIPTLPYYNSMALNMLLNADPSYTPNISDNIPAYNIILVVGTGGTGGFLVRDLSRYISTLPYAKTTLMVLMDADIVEPKNINRQNFIHADVDKNKAEVLAQRYGKAFGVKIVHIPEHLTDKNIDSIISPKFCLDAAIQQLGISNASDKGYGVNYIIASCVDNNKTRTLISNTLGLIRNPVIYPNSNLISGAPGSFFNSHLSGAALKSMTWIDSGNETHSGQVICYYDTLFTQLISSSGVYSGNKNNPYKFADIDQYFKNPAQYLYSFLLANPKFYDRNQSFQDVVAAAVNKWLHVHKLGIDANESSFAAWMKPIKELNPLAKDFTSTAKYVMAKAFTNIAMFEQNVTFPITFVYPTIWDQAGDKLNIELSCAEQSVVDPQNIMVNIQAASYMMNYFSRILASNPKTAMLNSFGTSWNHNQSREFYMTESVLKEIFTGMLKHIQPVISTRKADVYKTELFKTATNSYTRIVSRGLGDF